MSGRITANKALVLLVTKSPFLFFLEISFKEYDISTTVYTEYNSANYYEQEFSKKLFINLAFILGLVLAGLLRWTFSGFSGVINANVWGYDSAFLEGIFGQGNGSTIWLYIYSFLYYNLPYISVSIVLCIIVGLLLQKHIIKISEQEK